MTSTLEGYLGWKVMCEHLRKINQHNRFLRVPYSIPTSVPSTLNYNIPQCNLSPDFSDVSLACVTCHHLNQSNAEKLFMIAINRKYIHGSNQWIWTVNIVNLYNFIAPSHNTPDTFSCDCPVCIYPIQTEWCIWTSVTMITLGSKPLSDPMLAYYYLSHWEHV